MFCVEKKEKEVIDNYDSLKPDLTEYFDSESYEFMFMFSRYIVLRTLKKKKTS